jgi:crossover junction endodeoxyribonuclease RuvC
MLTILSIMSIVGIDPGLHGAVAILDPEAGTLSTFAMPTYRRGEKNYVDAVRLAGALRNRGITHGFIEDVFAMPDQGVVSMFTFGEGKGVLRGVLAGLEIEEVMVTPAKWKADLRTSADKKHTKLLARRLFPDCGKQLSSEGKCEAALIALWGVLSLNMTLGRVIPA